MRYEICITDPDTSNPKRISGSLEQLNWYADSQPAKYRAARMRKEWTLKAIDQIERGEKSPLWKRVGT